MKIIIAGSRDASWEQTRKAITRSPFVSKITVIVSGHHHSGADFWGEQYADIMGIPVILFPADWYNLIVQNCTVKKDKNGKLYNALAGFNRNQLMAEYADGLIAVRINKSKGTTDMIERAVKSGLYVFNWDIIYDES